MPPAVSSAEKFTVQNYFYSAEKSLQCRIVDASDSVRNDHDARASHVVFTHKNNNLNSSHSMGTICNNYYAPCSPPSLQCRIIFTVQKKVYSAELLMLAVV